MRPMITLFKKFCDWLGKQIKEWQARADYPYYPETQYASSSGCCPRCGLPVTPKTLETKVPVRVEITVPVRPEPSLN